MSRNEGNTPARRMWLAAAAAALIIVLAVTTLGDSDRAFAQAPAASITVILDTQPDAPDDFWFTTTGTGLSAFVLDDDADSAYRDSVTFVGLSASAYSVTGPVMPGWLLAAVSCYATGLPGTSGGVVRIALADGESASCRFIYDQAGSPASPASLALDGSITISTSAGNMPGSVASFTTVGLGSAFQVDDDPLTLRDNTIEFSNLAPGSYAVEELSADGWMLAYVSCDTGGTLVSLASRRIDFDLDPGQSIACTFVNVPTAVQGPPAPILNEPFPIAEPGEPSISTPERTAILAETPDSLAQRPATQAPPSGVPAGTTPLPPQSGTGTSASDGMRVIAALALVTALLAGGAATFLGRRWR